MRGDGSSFTGKALRVRNRMPCVGGLMSNDTITSAALVVNAKSRKGQKLFKRACAAMQASTVSSDRFIP